MVRIAPLSSPPVAQSEVTTMATALAACLGPALVDKQSNLEQDANKLAPARAADSRTPTAKLAGSLASCIPVASATLDPAAQVCIHPIRAANLLPMDAGCTPRHSGARPSQQLWVRAVCWVAGEPAAQWQSATVAVDAVSGGASWHDHDAPAQAFDEATMLPLPVVGQSTLVIELQLLAASPSTDNHPQGTRLGDSSDSRVTSVQEDRVRGHTDHVSQQTASPEGSTSLELIGGGVAHIPLWRLASGGAGHSTSSWVQVVGTGPPGTDGESLGECELLVATMVRHLGVRSTSVGSMEQVVDRDEGDPSSSSELPVVQAAFNGPPVPSHPPTSRVAASRSSRDGHGFALQVPELSHAAMVGYRTLVNKRQLRRWQQLGVVLAPPSLRRASMLNLAALGFPPTLRPRLWLHYSGAEAMRHEACVSGSYARLLDLQVGASESAAALLTGHAVRVHVAMPCASVDAAVVHVLDFRWLAALLQRLVTSGKRAVAQLLGTPSVPEDGMATVTRQIELDLPRTFPEHAMFAAEPGRSSLRRVLHAHARRNPDIGYTQSLNFIAAFLLLLCPADGIELSGGKCGREEAAFWMLCAITERLLPEHYTSGMVGVRVDNLVVVDMLESHASLQIVAAGFQSLDLDLSLVSTQWLLLAFLNALPTDTTLRIWDLFFVAGPRVLLAACVAAVHVLDAKLKEADGSFEETYMVLKNGLPHAALDDDVFVRRTLEALHELPDERFRELRARHRNGIMAETAEREARVQERRRKHDELHAGGYPMFAHKAVKAVMTTRKRAPITLLSAVLSVLLVALGIGWHTFSSRANADAGPVRPYSYANSYAAAIESETYHAGCAVPDGEGGCRRHHGHHPSGTAARSWSWVRRQWPLAMHKVRSLLRLRP